MSRLADLHHSVKSCPHSQGKKGLPAREEVLISLFWVAERKA
jgi:hypothetical protein